MAVSKHRIWPLFTFALAGLACVAVATVAAIRIEERSGDAVVEAMELEGLTWVDVAVDGLNVTLAGTAPTEAQRFRATSLARSVVDGDRVVVAMDVAAPDAIVAPDFQLEMLRNGDGISLIGLVPQEIGIGGVAQQLSDISAGVEVTDMVDAADYPVPETWDAALAYGLSAIRQLPRSKVSVYAGRVEIEAVSDSLEQRNDLLDSLGAANPDDVEVIIDISAPRPVIAPFTLRFVRDGSGIRFENCSAETIEARERIIAAARSVGMTGQATCEIGLGVPTPSWADAVETALRALAEIGEGKIAFTDADISLVANENTPREVFDRVVGELDAALPDVFSLNAVLSAPVERTASDGPPRFTAALNEEGLVDLRGLLQGGRVTEAVVAYAGAEFGTENVRLATRRFEDLPTGWSVRVMAGLGALGFLNSGEVVVEPDLLTIRGETGRESAVSDISRVLSEHLGATANFEIDVAYVEALDPQAAIPTPEECVARLNTILEMTKISFDPGSVEINEEAGTVLDAVAAVLPDCRHVAMEIGGHTDSQGRESMNERLSQARADAVLNGLMARNILISNLSARGYGESRPIAENDTEEGRESNRRIEFQLAADVAQAEQMALQEEREAVLLAVRPVPRPETASEDSESE